MTICGIVCNKTSTTVFKNLVAPLCAEAARFGITALIFVVKGAIQIIRDALGGGSRLCQQKTQGGGGVFSKMSRDIFWTKNDFFKSF